MSGPRPPLVGIVDYGMGNRRSVQKALEHVGAEVRLSSDHGLLREAGALVLPGVGAFPEGMESLRRLGLDGLLRERAAAGVPVLGICLGMQLLFERSQEGRPTNGLGLLEGEVSRLNAGERRLPHIGWNEVRFERRSALTAGFDGAVGRPFYHVHGFAVRPRRPEDVAGTCEYGERFADIVCSANIHGVQFHPEKSSHDGLQMLRAFVRLAGPA